MRLLNISWNCKHRLHVLHTIFINEAQETESCRYNHYVVYKEYRTP
jgi:hypothetical protein